MLEQIILGTIQGIFEWIPISSEGVVALVGQFFTKETNPVEMALFLHLGTLMAVLIYFREDWVKLITFKSNKLLLFLLISTPISLVLGLTLYESVKNIAIGNSLLLMTGLGLLLTAYFHKEKRCLNWAMWKVAIISGIAQGLSVIPGLSRSGSTMFGLSFGDLEPPEILRYSYIMSVPAVVASSGYLILKGSIPALANWPALLLSFVVGFASLNLILNLSRKINFYQFALSFGILCLAGAVLGFIF